MIVVIVALLSFSASNLFSLYTTVYVHFFIITLLFEVIHFFCKRYRIYHFLFVSVIISVVLTSAIFAYGFYNMRNIVETDYQFESDKIDSLKILQVSEIHMPNSTSVSMLADSVAEMSKLDVDIIFLTGDIFDENMPKQDMIEASALLGQIAE